MKEIPAPANLEDVKKEFKNYNITLEFFPRVTMDRVHNVPNTIDDREALIDKMAPVYEKTPAIDKDPHRIVIVYSDQHAEKETLALVQKDMIAGPGAKPVEIKVEDKSGTKKALWHNFNPKEDWFVDAIFSDENSVIYPIDKGICILPSGDKKTSIHIDLGLLPIARQAKGTISIEVNVVKDAFGGLAPPSDPFICVADTNKWEKVSLRRKTAVIVHELGHKLGLASDGGDNKPDKHKYYYPDKGSHVGPHCHYGLPVKKNHDKDLGQCVMFGRSKQLPITFCEFCKPSVRKVDIHSGFGWL